MKTKLFAIPHDGTLDGDSQFCPPEYKVPYTAGMNLIKLRKAVINHPEVGWSGKPIYNREELELTTEYIKGAWVVDSNVIDVLNATSPTCGDVNRAKKEMLNVLAKKFIGKRPK